MAVEITEILKRKCTIITKTRIVTLRRFSATAPTQKRTGSARSWTVFSNATFRLWFLQGWQKHDPRPLEVSEHTNNWVKALRHVFGAATTSSIRSFRFPQNLHGWICPRWMFAEHLRFVFGCKNTRGAQHRPYSRTISEKYNDVRYLRRGFSYTYCALGV
jgi:hypothetical protein